MSVVLPSSVSYTDSLPVLPSEAMSIACIATPNNGSVFTQNQQLYLDLGSRGFLIPDSMFLSYTYSLTTATLGAELIGCPAATPFSRLDVQVGSQIVDTIQNYNIFYHMLSNISMNQAERYGMQASFGYNNSTDTPNLEELDGRKMVDDETGSFAFPLVSLLSNAEKLIPLFALPNIRLTLTMDAISNIFTSVVVPTAFTISNVKLHYRICDMGPAVENIVLSSADKLYIKSQSFGVSSQTLAANTTGSVSLVFNQRYASCKAIFAINGGGVTASNRAFDSVDLTNGNGVYSFTIGQMQYPPYGINTATGKTAALLELRSAVGSVFDRNNSMSINSREFNFNGTSGSPAPVYNIPGKFYVAANLEKLNTESLLTGISTANSPISYNIQLSSSIGTNNSTITLIVNYDALIEVDTQTRQVAVKS